MKKKSISERAIIGFDHGLPCRVKNIALGPQLRQKLYTESLGPCFSHGMGDHDQIQQETEYD